MEAIISSTASNCQRYMCSMAMLPSWSEAARSTHKLLFLKRTHRFPHSLFARRALVFRYLVKNSSSFAPIRAHLNTKLCHRSQVFVFGPDKRIWELDKSSATAADVLERSYMKSFYEGAAAPHGRRKGLDHRGSHRTSAWVNGEEVSSKTSGIFDSKQQIDVGARCDLELSWTPGP